LRKDREEPVAKAQIAGLFDRYTNCAVAAQKATAWRGFTDFLTRLGVSVSVVLEDQPEGSPGTVEFIEVADHEIQRDDAPSPRI